MLPFQVHVEHQAGGGGPQVQAALNAALALKAGGVVDVTTVAGGHWALAISADQL